MQKDINKLLDPFHKEDLNNSIHPSIYLEHEHYDFLILRFPIETEDDKIELVSKGIIIANNEIFLYEREREELVKLKLGWESLHQLLDEIIDKTLLLVTNLREQIIDMEESLYTKQLKEEFLNHWFNVKKELIAINRVIVRTVTMYERFYEKNQKNIHPFINNFHDLLEHLSRSQRYVEHNIEKLNTIYNFYSARSNDKMNQSIYILTILSAIFLPLNLMVGFFGMNTGTLPFTEEGGTINVVLLLGATSLILFLFLLFRRNR
ncbi:magnesium transporter CorA family protein [bacterium]|nr:magnesium transporter CorA family protein [bacterium]MBU1957222.1 magnesium transporter CorA family protein [bacterium]